MKRIFTLLSLLNLLFIFDSSHGQDFENNDTYPFASWLSQMDTLDNSLVAKVSASGGSFIYKIDSLGNVIASNDMSLYVGGSHGTMNVKNGKVFFHAFFDQCDYPDINFIVHRYDANLNIEHAMTSWDWDDQDHPFYNSDGPYVDSRFVPINDSIIAIANYNRLTVINMNLPEVLVNIEYLFGDIHGLYPLSAGMDSLLIYGNSGIYLFSEEEVTQVNPVATYSFENYNGAFYRRGGAGVQKLDSSFNVIASNNLSTGRIQFDQGLLYCKSSSQMIVLNEDLSVVSMGSFDGLENFSVTDFCKFNDHYYLSGGNMVTYFTEGSTGFLKRYALDFETEHFAQDIGVTDIQVLGHNFYPEAIFQGNVMNYNLHLSLDVTVTNFTDSPVSSAKLVWETDPYNPMGLCGSNLRWFAVDSIAPNSSTVVHLTNSFYRNQSSPGNGNTTSVNVCIASHAPDKKVDDYRNNDSFCESFNLLFVGLDESIASPISCFYNPQHDHIEIRNVSDAQMHLYSMSGQLLNSVTLNRGDNQLPMDKYSSGIYLIRIETIDGVSVVKIGKP